jgi:hypothetical protein
MAKKVLQNILGLPNYFSKLLISIDGPQQQFFSKGLLICCQCNNMRFIITRCTSNLKAEKLTRA